MPKTWHPNPKQWRVIAEFQRLTGSRAVIHPSAGKVQLGNEPALLYPSEALRIMRRAIEAEGRE